MRGLIAVSLTALLIAACATPRSATTGRAPAQNFGAAQLAKSDIDRIIEAHQRELFATLKLVTEKLYKRNPKEWRKDGWQSADESLTRLFGSRHNWRFPELKGQFGSDAILMALREDYAGDRVFALSAGLGGMLLAAFGDKDEFYMLDDVDPQKLYNAARNIEIAVWKLSNARNANGELLLLSNDPGPPANLSFEREFGRAIGNLDLLAGVIADKTNRTLVKVVQSFASAVFLPVAVLK